MAARLVSSQLGRPKSVLVDAGYVNADAFDRLEREDVEIYCSVHREDPPRAPLRLSTGEGKRTRGEGTYR